MSATTVFCGVFSLLTYKLVFYSPNSAGPSSLLAVASIALAVAQATTGEIAEVVKKTTEETCGLVDLDLSLSSARAVLACLFARFVSGQDG